MIPRHAAAVPGDAPHIARVLNFIWLDDEQIPPGRQACIDSCIARHPGYEVRIWRSAAEFGLLRNRHIFQGASRIAPPPPAGNPWQVKSNVLRFEILARYGGVYIDTDVWCLSSLEPLLQLTETAGKTGMLAWEIQSKWLGEAVLACEPHAPFMERIVENLGPWALARTGKPATVTVGPQYITPLLRKHLDDVLVLPQNTFYPARHNQPELSSAIAAGEVHVEGCTAVHLFGNTRRRQGAPL